MQLITAPELAAWISDKDRPAPFLLDVREASEYRICHIAGSTLIPLNSISERHVELDKNAQIVCICHHGGRSLQAATFLERTGFRNISNLTGGVHTWAQQVDPTMPCY